MRLYLMPLIRLSNLASRVLRLKLRTFSAIVIALSMVLALACFRIYGPRSFADYLVFAVQLPQLAYFILASVVFALFGALTTRQCRNWSSTEPLMVLTPDKPSNGEA